MHLSHFDSCTTSLSILVYHSLCPKVSELALCIHRLRNISTIINSQLGFKLFHNINLRSLPVLWRWKLAASGRGAAAAAAAGLFSLAVAMVLGDLSPSRACTSFYWLSFLVFSCSLSLFLSLVRDAVQWTEADVVYVFPPIPFYRTMETHGVVCVCVCLSVADPSGSFWLLLFCFLSYTERKSARGDTIEHSRTASRHYFFLTNTPSHTHTDTLSLYPGTLFFAGPLVYCAFLWRCFCTFHIYRQPTLSHLVPLVVWL